MCSCDYRDSAIGNHPPIHDEINAGINDHGSHRLHSNKTIVDSGKWEDVYETFTPYTIAAPEMRRVIRDARSRHPLEDFDISGALLPGVIGDNKWRATASEADFILRRRFDERGIESMSCMTKPTDEDGAEPCDDWVHSVLLAPATNHIFTRLMRALLLQMPDPILMLDDGSHRLMHCMGE